jgi:hypothetical protein
MPLLASGVLDGERFNQSVEICAILNSAASEMEKLDRLQEIMQVHTQIKTEESLFDNPLRFLFNLLLSKAGIPKTPKPALPQQLTPQNPVAWTIADIRPFLAGSGPLTEEQDRSLEEVASKNPEKRQELKDLVVRMRTANSILVENFRNPLSWV